MYRMEDEIFPFVWIWNKELESKVSQMAETELFEVNSGHLGEQRERQGDSERLVTPLTVILHAWLRIGGKQP